MLVNAEDGSEAFWIFKIAVFGGLVSLGLFALLFMPLSISLLGDGVASQLVQEVVKRWPKMAADYSLLIQINPNYVEKYVVFNIMAAFTVAGFLILFLPPLLYYVKKGRQPIPKKFGTLKFLIGLPVAALLVLWVNLVLPTPFQTSGGFSTRIPAWELGLLYCALIWGAMQMLVVGTIVYLFKLIGNSKR